MTRPLRVTAAVAVTTVASGLALMTATSVAASSLPTLTLALTKHTITVGGAEVSGAVNIVTTVTGEPNDDPALLLLRPGVTPAEAASAIAHLGPDSPLDAIDPYASIVFEGYAAQGSPSTAQTWLEPGTYIALDNENGHAIFTVAASPDPALLPTPAATITAIDFAFRGAGTLHDGELVRFVNDGYLIHMFLAAQAKTPADASKAEALLLAGKAKQAARRYGTGVMAQLAGPLSHAELQQEVIDEPPGTYVLLCAMNAEDGRDHYQLGMYRTITIVR